VERSAVCVIGGGVVGVSVLLALARRGVDALLLEAEPELGLCASGTNSGVLHTGFDSPPGALETRLILRSGELREEVIDALDPPLLRCGAVMRPADEAEQSAVEELEARAGRNGVAVERAADGGLVVPDEMVTDPVAYTLALAAAAARGGARIVCGARVYGFDREGGGLVVLVEGDETVRCRLAVNCGGLSADDLARWAGDDDFRIVPRKGEFFVFDPPGREPLEQILLPVPSTRTKGVLVFPTTDRKVIAGPTAVDQIDKRDWSVRPGAAREVLERAVRLLPELEGQEPVASYAGLRTAGAAGENYLIERSSATPELLHVAAIRSTGLSASLGIAEYVLGCLERMGLELGEEQPLVAGAEPGLNEPWWLRSANYWST
jgi:glycerol-3-phosphate dehydrogenase